jgi:hypothetical protein
MDFETMVQETQKYLQENSKTNCVATALLTDKGNLYIDCCTTFNNCCYKTDNDYSFINDLIKNKDSRVLKMVTMVANEGLAVAPIPCAEICQQIYDMNKDNINTEVRFGNGETIPYLREFCN